MDHEVVNSCTCTVSAAHTIHQHSWCHWSSPRQVLIGRRHYAMTFSLDILTQFTVDALRCSWCRPAPLRFAILSYQQQPSRHFIVAAPLLLLFDRSLLVRVALVWARATMIRIPSPSSRVGHTDVTALTLPDACCLRSIVWNACLERRVATCGSPQAPEMPWQRRQTGAAASGARRRPGLDAGALEPGPFPVSLNRNIP